MHIEIRDSDTGYIPVGQGFGRDCDVTDLYKIHTFLNNGVRLFIESLPIGKVEFILARQRLEV